MLSSESINHGMTIGLLPWAAAWNSPWLTQSTECACVAAAATVGVMLGCTLLINLPSWNKITTHFWTHNLENYGVLGKFFKPERKRGKGIKKKEKGKRGTGKRKEKEGKWKRKKKRKGKEKKRKKEKKKKSGKKGVKERN